MQCPTINNLTLTQADLDALEAIRRLERNGNLLQLILPAGVLANIFLGSNGLQASYNIHSTDWVQFASAMTHISPIVKNRIVTIAQMEQLRRGITYEQRLFWKAVELGCSR